MYVGYNAVQMMYEVRHTITDDIIETFSTFDEAYDFAQELMDQK